MAISKLPLYTGPSDGASLRDYLNTIIRAMNAAIDAINGIGGIFAAIAYSGSASDLVAGTVPPARLPTPTLITLGGLKASAGTAHQFVTEIDTTGTQITAQPAFSDISGTIAPTQIPTPTAATLGGVLSKAATTHEFVTGVDLTGAPTVAQPAAGDLQNIADQTVLANNAGASGPPLALTASAIRKILGIAPTSVALAQSPYTASSGEHIRINASGGNVSIVIGPTVYEVFVERTDTTAANQVIFNDGTSNKDAIASVPAVSGILCPWRFISGDGVSSFTTVGQG